jgi:hypothetical protein
VWHRCRSTTPAGSTAAPRAQLQARPVSELVNWGDAAAGNPKQGTAHAWYGVEAKSGDPSCSGMLHFDLCCSQFRTATVL